MLAKARGGADGFVLIHGGSGGSWFWDRVSPLLKLPALAVELPGRNGKPGDLETITIADCVTSVVADLNAARLERAIVVGHSMSGVIVTALASRLPERVAQMVFISCAIPPEGGCVLDAMRPVTRWIVRLGLSAQRSCPRKSLALPRWFARHWLGNDMDREQLRFVLDRFVPGEAPRLLTEHVKMADLPADIPKTYIKLLLDRSGMSPARQDRAIANLGGATVLTLNAGHGAMVSRPRELAALLNRIADRN